MEEVQLLKDYKLSWIESLAGRILTHGRIPKHLAVIMDGNRRYARQRHQKYIDGHNKGFSKLSEVLFWCRTIGITEVTVYAFSIENFRRSQEEVDGLMKLAEDKFREILKDEKKLKDEGVCIRVIGNFSYLPVSLQQACADLVLATKDHTRCFLNIALSYTSREEMCTAIGDMVKGADEGVLKPNDFSEAVLSEAMYSRYSPDPDLLIRTSGEARLSDFLLWQTGFTVVEFIPALWPELSIWQFFGAIINYQWQVRAVDWSTDSSTSLRKGSDEVLGDTTTPWGHGDERLLAFRGFIEERRTRLLNEMSLGKSCQRPLDDVEL